MTRKLTLQQVDEGLHASGSGIRRATNAKYIDRNTPMDMICHCGNPCRPSYGGVVTGCTKSCGHCNDPKIGDIFNQITITEVITNTCGGGGCRIKGRCDCGAKITERPFNYVKNGHTKSCGHCNDPSVGDTFYNWTITSVYPARNNGCRIDCICRCGTTCNNIKFGEISGGHTKSCGHCNDPKIGDTYGNLTITEVMPNRSGGCSVRARCNCGEIVGPYRSNVLKSGNTKSCGHCSDPRIDDVFEYLTVIKVIPGKLFGCMTWCKCKCGNMVGPLPGNQLTNGNNLSCGCIKGVRRRKLFDAAADDMLRYNFILLEYISMDRIAKLRCHCGRSFYITPHSIKSNNIMSCGCLTKSKGQLKLESILDQLNTNYQSEYSFPNCRNKGRLLFDLYIPHLNLCIEYQGKQHYKVIKHWGGEEGFKNRLLCDQIKRDFCATNGIPFYEIPFTYFDQLPEILEDLVAGKPLWEFDYPEVQTCST